MGKEGGAPGWQAGGLSQDEYIQMLVAYDAALAGDSYVLGATVFTCGATTDWSAFDCDPLAAQLAALSVVPTSAPSFTTQGDSMSQHERDLYYADLYRRFGVPLNPASALYTHWRAQANAGNWFGPPLESEHPTLDGRYIYQSFASKVLTYDTTSGAVTEGLPPLS